MKLILIILSIFTVKSCGTTNAKNNLQQENITLEGLFKVNILNGDGVRNLDLTVAFNSQTKRISGFSGCNSYTGSYTTKTNSLKIGPLASTRKMCINEKVNTTEYEFLNVLSKVDGFRLNEDNLSLSLKGEVLVEASINNVIAFEYVALSRGFYHQIKISKDSISISKVRNAKTIQKECSSKVWKSLVEATKKIDLINLSTIEPPSTNHQFDGAPLARLTITQNGSSYETQSFDHGNPPRAIANLVKEILSIVENVE